MRMMKKGISILTALVLALTCTVCFAEEAMPRAEIGIIGAIEEEINGLVAKLDDVRECSVGGCTFYQGSVDGHSVVVGMSGMGKVYAAMCAQAMILQYAPDAILNIGMAGAVSEELKIGDVVIPTDEIQHDYDVTALGLPLGTLYECNIANFPCDAEIMTLIGQACAVKNLPVVYGTSASGDQFVEGMEKKHWLTENFGAIICEMEGGAIAQVCYTNEVPFATYRLISDIASGSEFAANMQDVARQSAELAYGFLKVYFAK